MEATLQKTKPKSHRTKSKQSKKIELDLMKEKLNCADAVKNYEQKLSEVNLEEINHICDPKVESPISVIDKLSTEHVSIKTLENNLKKEGINKGLELDLLHSDEQAKPSEISNNKTNFEKTVETPVNPTYEISSQVNLKCSNLYPSADTVNSEKALIKVHSDATKTLSLHMYPDLKSLQFCEQMHNIISSQTLVKTTAEKFKTRNATAANKCFQEFVEVIHDVQNHPLMDMVSEFHRAKKSSVQLRSRLKYLKSDLKRRKDSLWRTVNKQASAKGKCDDGYTVNMKRTYTIKELDEEKFSEIKSILKEIEELLLSDAFHSYVEEVTRLRIDHYVYDLIENEKIAEIKGASGEFHENDLISLKKSISVLFDSQRQNVQDKHYLTTCQNWLKTLVSKLIKRGNFEDNLFLINHVIRCPNGIENWASALIQVPVDISTMDETEIFDSRCAQEILLSLYLIFNPVPLKEFFLKNIKDTVTDSEDTKFTVIDSEGEEEEFFEMSKNFSDGDVLSLLHQIPVRSVYKHFLLDCTNNSGSPEIIMLTEERMLKLFAYTTAIIDVLFNGLETYYSESFPSLFESLTNLIRHILLYISKYWTHHVNMNNHFKSEIQAVYDKLFFHIVFKIYSFEKIHIWRIMPALPYEHISEKMLWNILWIFFSPGRSEEQIYLEKDVEIKIKDESVQVLLVNHIKNLPVHDILQLLQTIEKIITSRNNDKDFIKFSYHVIFQVTLVEPSLRNILSIEGSVILTSVAERYPYLVSMLLKEIDRDYGDIADEKQRSVCNSSFLYSSEDISIFQRILNYVLMPFLQKLYDIPSQCIDLFKKMNISNWIPEDNDVSILSSWLLSDLNCGKNQLSRLILKNMNWDYNEEGLLSLPYDLHKQVAVLVTEAYVKFDANNNNDQGLVSKGVKQMLQFTSIGSQKQEQEFIHWAWNILFSLKLHPLDRKHPPWVEVYDGYVEEYDKPDFNSSIYQQLSLAYENKHPSGYYLMLIMSNDGHSMKSLLNKGLECFSNLVECEQYMAAIRSLYYILPFFVKNPEGLLKNFGFIKAMSDLVTADLTVMSNITGEPVIGAVLHKVAAIIKYQIYQASKCTIECAAPLIKLWIKILMKLLSSPESPSSASALKNSAKQVHFLLDVLVRIAFLHEYTRECILDLLNSYCKPLNLLQVQQSTLWSKIFSSNPSMNVILNRYIIPEYPWLAWHVLLSEMSQKCIEDLWIKAQTEMAKQKDDSSATCLKRISNVLKVNIECLPIYRWAYQAVETPISHPVYPLIWQQFFLYYFHRVLLTNSSENFASIGMKYFKSSYMGLYKKMKKCLSDAENYYKNLLKTSESECTETAGKSNCDIYGKKELFYLNLKKLFQAFRLWLDDESLQESGLCLSAVEPKYCPHRLKLILNGDKTVWFDMVSILSLKDEIDQKIHSWTYSKKTPNKVVECHMGNEESLPQLMMRHLQKYETISPAVEIKPTSVSLGINDVPFTSKDAVVYLIEQNQCGIFDKAQYFCEQMKKLKQLNISYIDWTPQEYEIEKYEVTEMKVCHKYQDCSGAAFFRLQIERCKKNERISERIENNRADYLIVQDQLSKLPVKDLCISSLQIENSIRSLANKMKESKSKEDFEKFRKMGIALFYHEIGRIDKIIPSVAGYPPSCQFFSLIIESLGREFLDGDEAELKELAQSILNHPESGALALPLFNPGKAGIQNFCNVYKTLTSSVGGKYSASTLLALFSKIDFSQWLNEHAPSFDIRKIIFNNVSDALFVCGHTPSLELYPIFYILKRHFGILLQYMFPDLFLTAIVFLLKGIEDKKLNIEVYYEAFHCFGCPLFSEKSSVEDIEFALRKFAQNQQLPADQQIFVSVPQLNLQQVSYVAHLLYKHFKTKRSSCVLYKEYAAYLKPLGIFLAIISHSFVALHLDEISSVNEPLCVSDLWQTFHNPFVPWLHPICMVNNCGLDFPWADDDLTAVRYMFQIFSSSLIYFHQQILQHGSEESVISYMWSFYVETYVIPGHRHYSVSLCHSELLNLPWHEFHPCTRDIEGMCKVLQSNLRKSKEFLSKISLKIPWRNVMQTISITKSPDYVGRVLGTLGKLLIISQLDCTDTDSNAYPNVLKEMETLPWHFLSMGDTEVLLDLYYSYIDTYLLISNWNNCSEFHVLQFLKLICCMVPNPDAEEFSNFKRISYLQKFVSTLSACCSKKRKEMLDITDKFKDIITSLFDEIEVIISNGTKPSEQANYALPLMKEVLSLLNSLPEGELNTAALKSITEWLSSNKKSPLLLPCLKVSCQNLNSVSHMVPIIECCICTRFSEETLDAHNVQSIWQLISSYFSVHANIFNDFVEKCVKENAHMTLYCCLLSRLPNTDSTDNKKMWLERILMWIRESKLNLDAEAKSILLWDKLLDLSFKLIYEEEFQAVRQTITAFCWILESLAEDRSSSGFFAMIGFGEVSCLSVNFRFLCRVMVAFLQYQIPANGPIRIEPSDMENLGSSSCGNASSKGSSTSSHGSSTSASACKALENLKGLQLKRQYSALQSQIDYASKCVSDPKWTFLQCRELLKYFAVILYPKESYLSALDT